jgi:hypothetical protein
MDNIGLASVRIDMSIIRDCISNPQERENLLAFFEEAQRELEEKQKPRVILYHDDVVMRVSEVYGLSHMLKSRDIKPVKSVLTQLRRSVENTFVQGEVLTSYLTNGRQNYHTIDLIGVSGPDTVYSVIGLIASLGRDGEEVQILPGTEPKGLELECQDVSRDTRIQRRKMDICGSQFYVDDVRSALDKHLPDVEKGSYGSRFYLTPINEADGKVEIVATPIKLSLIEKDGFRVKYNCPNDY